MYRFSVVLVAVISFFSFIMLGLLFYPITVIKPNVQPYQVLTKKVSVGEELIYVIDACKYIDTSAFVGRIFVDSQTGTEYPALSDTNHVGTGCGKTNAAILVPPLLLPGRMYYLQIDVTYKINALRDKLYHFRTETFEVATGAAALQQVH